MIGLSLPLGYLVGTPETDEARCFKDALGTPTRGLAELKGHGVGSIEIQGFRADTPAHRLLDAVTRLRDAGMTFTLHGYLHGDGERCSFREVYPSLLSTVEDLHAHGDETIMVVHAFSDPHAAYETLLESTARALTELLEGLSIDRIPVRVCLEINRYHGVDTPGARYDGLLEIARRMEGLTIGFCWDMGHTCSSTRQNQLTAIPPSAFVRNVIHTHVHGLSPDGDTHRPLTEFRSHIVSGVRQLRSVGYRGIYNLELYPRRWGPEPRGREGILDSLRHLYEILSQTSETRIETSSIERDGSMVGKDFI